MEKQTPKKKIILDNNQIQIEHQRVDSPTKSKYQLKRSKKTDLDEAINSLNQLSIPHNIPCRQNQKKAIQDFILRGVKSIGCSEILQLDISGVPGIGKTISVLEILQKLKHLQSFQKDTIQININSMNLTRPQYIYSSILYQLTDYKQKNIVKSLNLLNQIFEKGFTSVKIPNSASINRMIGKIKIIFIDELDYLNTKNQEVLYNLFEWPKSKFSKIVMITVSNTIDFPQRIEQKIVSRIGNQRLVFRPYTSDQIQIIIKDRLEAVNVFQENAISYACRKIAKFSSDIRKSLLVLRSAVELFKARKGGFSKNEKISIQYITQAHEKIYNDPIIKSISHLPDLVKIVIIKICFQIHLSGKGCWFTQLWYRMSVYNKKLFESSSKVSQILYLLKQLNIVRLKNMNRYKDTRIQKSIVMYNNTQQLFIELQIDIDQIFNALMNEEELVNQIESMKAKSK